MRISDRFMLGYGQHELDFVDIDPAVDTPLYLDPFFLANRTDPWSVDAHRTLSHFFGEVLGQLTAGRRGQAQHLMRHLGEPNETCLGMSRGHPEGRGVGPVQAGSIVNQILDSRAITTGLVEDLQDLRVLVPGIGPDKLSDITTNVIRRHLLVYTAAQAEIWDIPLTADVPTGFFWDPELRRWRQEYAARLVVDDRPLLLVPKGIVSFAKDYTPYRYHQHFVLNFLRDEHLRMNASPFVHVRETKQGTRREVYKSELKERIAPLNNDFLVDFTLGHPQVFQEFREAARDGAGRSLESGNIDSTVLQVRETGEPYDNEARRNAVADYLSQKLTDTPAGTDDADDYHKLVVAILEFCFYPRLTCPQVEQKIHAGRKRIDITFDNSAGSGQFYLLHEVHGLPCRYVMVECKNYTKDPNNPEIDQLSGRFSMNRGRVGLLVAREAADEQRLLERCQDTYHDNRGLVVYLLDADLQRLLAEAREGVAAPGEDLLRDRIRAITLA